MANSITRESRASQFTGVDSMVFSTILSRSFSGKFCGIVRENERGRRVGKFESVVCLVGSEFFVKRLIFRGKIDLR